MEQEGGGERKGKRKREREIDRGNKSKRKNLEDELKILFRDDFLDLLSRRVNAPLLSPPLLEWLI